MAGMSAQTGPILYQNVEHSITLVDIPLSIAAAQGTEDEPARRLLLSSRPLDQPRDALNEPKAGAAEAKVRGNQVHQVQHSIYSALIRRALADVHAHHSGDWCTPRALDLIGALSPPGAGCVEGHEGGEGGEVDEVDGVDDSTNCNNNNGSEDASHGGASHTRDVSAKENAITPATRAAAHSGPAAREPNLQSVMPLTGLIGTSSLASSPGNDDITYRIRRDSSPHESAGPEEACKDLIPLEGPPRPWEAMFHNSARCSVEMLIAATPSQSRPDPPPCSVWIPPRSSFLLGDCSQPAAFRAAVRSFAQDYDAPRKFDFILLDPPWPNRSARRKRSYSIQHRLRDVRRMLLGMDLDMYLAPAGLVGVWITNKAAVRQLVLGAGGLFQRLNVGLIEEWIWVKTTARGEPVTPLEGVWRKPYEVLLLARAPTSGLALAERAAEIQRRVLVGVPDLHSRKPCLKELVADLLPGRSGYRALEVFARHLVAGWWSWGNEVLKFNRSEHWTAAVRTPGSAPDA